MTESSFADLNLPQGMLSNLKDLGYHSMTPIQAQSLPLTLKGKDLIAKAKTGSGKTAAFALGVINKLNLRDFSAQGLVLCPTRELANQVAVEIRRLARYQQNIKVVVLCGGQPIGPQIGSLEHGAHIVVGTPGRLKDHLRKGTLVLPRLKTLVLDEADRMLDMGFYDDIEEIINETPKNRQTLLFSATYPDKIKQVSADFQIDPVTVSVEAVHTETKIQQSFYEVENSQKDQAMLRVMAQQQPESCIIFCNMKHQCDEVADLLNQQGYVAMALHGDMEQREREQTLVQFSNQSATILVATDVAARGLDIADLQLVLNYDMPRDTDTFVHRIGRTGRAGKEGTAITFSTPGEYRKMQRLEDTLQKHLPSLPLTDLPQSHNDANQPPMVTLCIQGGKKQKVRPGDILGALTGEAGIAGDQVGKINVMNFVAFVAIKRESSQKALGRLLNGKIKGRRFPVRVL